MKKNVDRSFAFCLRKKCVNCNISYPFFRSGNTSPSYLNREMSPAHIKLSYVFFKFETNKLDSEWLQGIVVFSTIIGKMQQAALISFGFLLGLPSFSVIVEIHFSIVLLLAWTRKHLIKNIQTLSFVLFFLADLKQTRCPNCRA